MQNKNLVIALVIGAIIVLGLGWKALSSSSASSGSGSEAVTLTTDPNPLQTGPATFIIDVKDNTGKPVDNATVSFDLNMTTMNMGTQQGIASPQGNGRYAAAGRMSMRGPWRVTTKVTMPDGSVVNKDFTVNVP
jgi:nitrogen fixation protein FixH